MEQATTFIANPVAQGGRLNQTIGRLRSEFAGLKNELANTKSENSRLQREVARWRFRFQALRVADVASLRRHVAFYCHPDRGGDAELMSCLNALFDILSSPVEMQHCAASK